MASKKERVLFDPEKQIDFIKLVENLDWTQEVNPVSLVKAVNKTAGLIGRHKYETNEVSFGKLLKSLESRISEFVDIRIHGRDRFYRIKPGVDPGDMIEKLGGKRPVKPVKEEKEPEVKEELKATDPAPVITKKEFPDSEAFIKTICLLKFFKVYGNPLNLKDCGIRQFIEKQGWKRTRTLEGENYTFYKEVKKVLTDFLYLPSDSLWIGKGKSNTAELRVDKPINTLIEDVSSLIDDPTSIAVLMGLLGEIKKPGEPKASMPAPKPTPEPKKAGLTGGVLAGSVMATKPAAKVGTTGKLVEKVGTAKPATEHPLVRWKKAVILDELSLLKHEDQIKIEDLQKNLRDYRFLELREDELLDLINQLESTQTGTFKLTGQSVTIRNFGNFNILCGEYDSRKQTDEIYLRVKLGKKALSQMYPDLDIQIASPISEEDNVYRVVVSKHIDSERALAKLIWCLRPGETVFEPKSNWTLRRINTIIDKMGLNIVY